MKVFLIIVFLIFTANAFADSGEACRYKVKLKSQEGIHEGYLYIWTYTERFDAKEIEFIDYLKKVVFQDSITLYTQIKTVSIRNANYPIEIDLASKSFIKTISKDVLQSADLLEELEYYPGDRVHQVTEEAYANLDSKNTTDVAVYNSEYAENCVFLLISERNNTSLASERNILEKGLESSLKVKVDSPDILSVANEFIFEKRRDLQKKGIILLLHYDAL